MYNVHYTLYIHCIAYMYVRHTIYELRSKGGVGLGISLSDVITIISIRGLQKITF